MCHAQETLAIGNYCHKLLLSSLILLWAIIEAAVADVQALEGCEEHWQP